MLLKPGAEVYSTGRLVPKTEHEVEGKDGKVTLQICEHELSCRGAYRLAKKRLCEMTMLAQPDLSKPMVIFTDDASKYAAAGVIARSTGHRSRSWETYSRRPGLGALGKCTAST